MIEELFPKTRIQQAGSLVCCLQPSALIHFASKPLLLQRKAGDKPTYRSRMLHRIGKHAPNAGAFSKNERCTDAATD
jgi:hypothetical protein